MLNGVITPPPPPPPPLVTLLSVAPWLFEVFATAGCGREFERDSERGKGNGKVADWLEGWWWPSTPPLPLGIVEPKVFVIARESGSRGYRTSSVRSHKQNCVSCPTDPKRYVTDEAPPLELCRESLESVLLVRTRPNCSAPCWKSSSLPLSSIGSSSSSFVVNGSNATTLTHDLCPCPRATTRLSANDQTVTKSSSPPVARYFPSGLQETQRSPPK